MEDSLGRSFMGPGEQNSVDRSSAPIRSSPSDLPSTLLHLSSEVSSSGSQKQSMGIRQLSSAAILGSAMKTPGSFLAELNSSQDDSGTRSLGEFLTLKGERKDLTRSFGLKSEHTEDLHRKKNESSSLQEKESRLLLGLPFTEAKSRESVESFRLKSASSLDLSLVAAASSEVPDERHVKSTSIQDDLNVAQIFQQFQPTFGGSSGLALSNSNSLYLHSLKHHRSAPSGSSGLKFLHDLVASSISTLDSEPEISLTKRLNTRNMSDGCILSLAGEGSGSSSAAVSQLNSLKATLLESALGKFSCQNELTSATSFEAVHLQEAAQNVGSSNQLGHPLLRRTDTSFPVSLQDAHHMAAGVWPVDLFQRQHQQHWSGSTFTAARSGKWADGKQKGPALKRSLEIAATAAHPKTEREKSVEHNARDSIALVSANDSLKTISSKQIAEEQEKGELPIFKKQQQLLQSESNPRMARNRDQVDGGNKRWKASSSEDILQLTDGSVSWTSLENGQNEQNLQENSTMCKVRAKRGCATHPRSIAERVRRTRISENMKKLQDLVPNVDKQANTADMLEEAVRYMKYLKHQVRELAGARAEAILQGPDGHRVREQNQAEEEDSLAALSVRLGLSCGTGGDEKSSSRLTGSMVGSSSAIAASAAAAAAAVSPGLGGGDGGRGGGGSGGGLTRSESMEPVDVNSEHQLSSSSNDHMEDDSFDEPPIRKYGLS